MIGRDTVSLHQALYAYVHEVLFHFYEDRLLSAFNWSDLFSSPHSLAPWPN